MSLICIIHQSLAQEHQRMLRALHWKQAHGVAGKSVGSLPCDGSCGLVGKKMAHSPRSVEERKEPHLQTPGLSVYWVGDPCVAGVHTLSFPSVCVHFVEQGSCHSMSPTEQPAWSMGSRTSGVL